MRTDTIITFYDKFLEDELPVTFYNTNKSEALDEILGTNYKVLGKVIKIEEVEVLGLWDKFIMWFKRHGGLKL